jgi:hypothetical protein
MVSSELLEDARAWGAIVDDALAEWRDDLLYGPRLGPGRDEWQRCKRKRIYTERHGRLR